LHPNSRPHWAAKAKATKSARTAAFYLVRSVCKATVGWAGAKLDITFQPPSKHRRDLDGLIASLKAAQDGISDAIGVNDHNFIPTYRMGTPVKGGAVLVTISEAKP
jgi:crossover junction endodeoxyribonuclease RusA